MKKSINVIIILLCIFLQAKASGSSDNLQKYWIYRERLKNFMYSGSVDGAGMIMTGRNAGFDPALPPGKMATVADDGWYIGYWIATLAMEWKLLHSHGYSTAQTEQDLYYAIDAILRLDYKANQSWGCTSGSIDGFISRDDFPDLNTLNNINALDGDKAINNLTKSWVPLNDAYPIHCVSSAWTDYSNAGGEASKDHWAGLYMGLVFVAKCVPNSVTYNGTIFRDNLTTSITDEVCNISDRFVKYIRAHGYILTNPCQGNRCVLGVQNAGKTTSCNTGGTTSGSNCRLGGSTGDDDEIGFVACNYQIQMKGTDAAKQSYAYSAYYNHALHDPIAKLKWDAALQLANAGNVSLPFGIYDNKWSDKISLTLAALSNQFSWVPLPIGAVLTFFGAPPPVALVVINVYSPRQTLKKMAASGSAYNWEHLILMNRYLYGDVSDVHGNTIKIDESTYECILDAAPCRGFDGYDYYPIGGNLEWGGGDRLWGESVGSTGIHADALNGLGYMFYYNLYNLKNTAYTSNYQPIHINQLALNNILKEGNQSGLPENSKKNFMAANSIIAKNGYTIANDVWASNADVNFVSGNYISLQSGFSVMPGALFQAHIQTGISACNCIEPVPANSFCSVSGNWRKSNEQNGSNLNTTNNSAKSNTGKPSFSASIFPNPFIIESNLIFTLPSASKISICIFNEIGIKQQLINEVNYTAGTHSITINAAALHLSQGVYFYSISSDETTEVKRFVVVQ